MDNSFLGRGWSFPPGFSTAGCEVDMVQDEDDILQCLELLLSTRLGERTLVSNFGSDLTHFLFEEVDQSLLNKLTDTISDAVLLYEPRVTLEKIDITESDAQRGLLLISLQYVVKAVNSRFNMVYPYYINESTKM
jgi:phage baseplate assembly protein W